MNKVSIISFVICFLLGCVCIIGIEHMKSLNAEIKSFKTEKTELQNKISEIESENQTYKVEILDYESSVDSLNSEIKIQRKRISSLSKEVNSSKVRNDTILIYLPLYEEKENQTDSLIRNFEKIFDLKDSIIFDQRCIIQNDSLLQIHLKREIEGLSDEKIRLTKKLRNEKMKKTV